MFKTQVERRAAGEWFHCKVLNILWVISMLYKSVDHGKLWSICFLQWHLFLVSCEVSRKIMREETLFWLFFAVLLHLCSFKHQLTFKNFSHMLKFGSSLSMLRSKIIFTKNQKQNNRHCVACYVISMVYSLLHHSSRPISMRGFAQLL